MSVGSIEVLLRITAREVHPVAGIKGSAGRPIALDHVYRPGTDDDQARRVYQRDHTVAGGGTLELDLAGALDDLFSQTVTFTEVVGVAVFNRSALPVSVGPKAATPFGVGAAGFFADASDKVMVAAASGQIPGVAFLHAPAGVAVTAGTADVLEVVNPGGSAVDLTVVIWGR